MELNVQVYDGGPTLPIVSVEDDGVVVLGPLQPDRNAYVEASAVDVLKALVRR